MDRLTKAYIVELTDNLAKIRIPEIHGIEGVAGHTPNSDLPFATINTINCLKNYYQVGDIVWVDFENGNLSTPVIMGQFLMPDTTNGVIEEDTNNSNAKLFLEGLNVKGKTVLGASTSIGKVNQTEISHLSGVKQNIQVQFDSILETNAKYNAEYYTSSFEQLQDWKLDDKGINITTKLLDSENNYDEVDTVDYIDDAIKQNSILNNQEYFENSQGSKYYYTKGYNKDVRLRTNWMGSFGTNNDKAKAQFGLFSRNYWESLNAQGTIYLEGAGANGNYKGASISGDGVPSYIPKGSYYTDSFLNGYDTTRHLAEVAFIDDDLFARVVVGDTNSYQIYKLDKIGTLTNSYGQYTFNDDNLGTNEQLEIDSEKCNLNKLMNAWGDYRRYRITKYNTSSHTSTPIGTVKKIVDLSKILFGNSGQTYYDETWTYDDSGSYGSHTLTANNTYVVDTSSQVSYKTEIHPCIVDRSGDGDIVFLRRNYSGASNCEYAGKYNYWLSYGANAITYDENYDTAYVITTTEYLGQIYDTSVMGRIGTQTIPSGETEIPPYFMNDGSYSNGNYRWFFNRDFTKAYQNILTITQQGIEDVYTNTFTGVVKNITKYVFNNGTYNIYLANGNSPTAHKCSYVSKSMTKPTYTLFKDSYAYDGGLDDWAVNGSNVDVIGIVSPVSQSGSKRIGWIEQINSAADFENGIDGLWVGDEDDYAYCYSGLSRITGEYPKWQSNDVFSIYGSKVRNSTNDEYLDSNYFTINGKEYFIVRNMTTNTDIIYRLTLVEASTQRTFTFTKGADNYSVEFTYPEVGDESFNYPIGWNSKYFQIAAGGVVITGTQRLLLNEYSWRPTVQGYVKKDAEYYSNTMALVPQIENDNTQQSYESDYLPYYLMLNPEGGTVQIGRGGYFEIHDEKAWAEKEQWVKLGELLIKDDEKLKVSYDKGTTWKTLATTDEIPTTSNMMTLGTEQTANGKKTFSGDVLFSKPTDTASLSTLSGLEIGSTSGKHLSMLANGIQAINNTSKSQLRLNPLGGNISFGGSGTGQSTAISLFGSLTATGTIEAMNGTYRYVVDSSNTTNYGYIKYSDGLIIQWGKKTWNRKNSNEICDFSFGISFSSTDYMITAIIEDTTENNYHITCPIIHSKSSSGCRIGAYVVNNGSYSTGMYYIAIGY